MIWWILLGIYGIGVVFFFLEIIDTGVKGFLEVLLAVVTTILWPILLILGVILFTISKIDPPRKRRNRGRIW